MSQAEKIIVALDVDSFEKAKSFIDRLYPAVQAFKIGSQLFTLCGPKIVEYTNEKGASVFLDLKFFDIPNTVANAVRSAVNLNVKMLTLHISGGEPMLKAAVEAAKDEAEKLKIKRPLLIGVTVLTSQETSPDKVLQLARQGLSCGLDGVVCSAQEVSLLREKLGKDFVIVTPGIRSRDDRKADQKRTATADEALRAGSDFLVVGRPILEAKDPKLAVNSLFED